MKKHGSAIMWGAVLVALAGLAWWLYYKATHSVQQALNTAASNDLTAAQQISPTYATPGGDLIAPGAS